MFGVCILSSTTEICRKFSWRIPRDTLLHLASADARWGSVLRWMSSSDAFLEVSCPTWARSLDITESFKVWTLESLTEALVGLPGLHRQRRDKVAPLSAFFREQRTKSMTGTLPPTLRTEIKFLWKDFCHSGPWSNSIFRISFLTLARTLKI